MCSRSEGESVSGSKGASVLTTEQADWFKDKYGVRYVGVQTNASVPSRAQRRAMRKKRGKR